MACNRNTPIKRIISTISWIVLCFFMIGFGFDIVKTKSYPRHGIWIDLDPPAAELVGVLVITCSVLLLYISIKDLLVILDASTNDFWKNDLR